MRITQISIFLENRKGRLYDVCQVLGENQINIIALTIAETESFGVLRIVVDKVEEAVNVLKEHQFVANLTEVIVVEVENKPGGLAKVLKILDDNNINIEYMHAFMKNKSDNSYMVFRIDNIDEAVNILQKYNFKIVTKDTIM